MFESESHQSSKPVASARTLKIEADGDWWKGLIKPKIRLMGRWLERAGFSAGSRVHVTCVARGVIELRSPAASTVNAPKPAPPEPPKSSCRGELTPGALSIIAPARHAAGPDGGPRPRSKLLTGVRETASTTRTKTCLR